MRYKIVLVFSLFLLSAVSLMAHSGKPRHHVIIDTDGALDDMRAISMLLSGNEIRVVAITCSQGTLAPDLVYQRVTSLLKACHHEGIPVVMGERIDTELPYWSAFAGSIPWVTTAQEGAESDDNNGKASEKVTGAIRIIGEGTTNNVSQFLQQTVQNYPSEITLIALGSLKTFADGLRLDPAISKKITKVVWYNDQPNEEGFNYNLSPESYASIVGSGIQLEVVSAAGSKLYCNREYLNHIGSSETIYARQITTLFSGLLENSNFRQNRLWDDLVPLYLSVPILFSVTEREGVHFISINERLPAEFVYQTIATLLNSTLTTNNRVFERFPVDKSLYKKEVAEILDSTLERYGPEEWKAIALTNEIHGHTGIYSIIGAKMGIRAMEYFHVGINNMQVVSYAGDTPPLSCLTDGVQISTGATPGQGLLTVKENTFEVPTVRFEFNDRAILMSLNKAIAEKMIKEIRYGVENYGLESEVYWLYIEKLAIEYWTDFSRHEIFSIQSL
jgi:pyrimidine-specific ribonucleoside hydrolase